MMTTSIEVEGVVQITPPPESLLITHTQNHEAYKCSEAHCPFTTSSPSLLGLHKAQVHKIKTGTKKGVDYQYFCPAPGCCFNPHSGRFFKVLDHLKTHYMKVHVEKKFKCSKCQRAFGLERDCLRHEKVCGQIFTCAECGKQYSNKPALSMHCLSKGHTPPPRTQKVPKTAKSDAKSPKKKSSQKDRKKEMATVPILPKLPLPDNVSILVPTDTNELTQSLCETLASLGHTSHKVNQSAEAAPITDQVSGPIKDGSTSINSALSHELPIIGNSFALLSFNADPYTNASTPSSQSLMAASMLATLQNSSSSTSSDGISRNSPLKLSQEPKDQNLNSFKVNSSSNKRHSQNPVNSQVSLSNDHPESNNFGRQNKVVVLTSQSHGNTFTLDSLKSHVSLASSVLSSNCQTEPIKKGLSVSCHGQMAQTPILTTLAANSVISMKSPLCLVPNVSASQNVQMEETVIEKNTGHNRSSASFGTLDSHPNKSSLRHHSGLGYVPLTVVQTQSSVPNSTNNLISDSGTQTLDNLMPHALSSFLTDCETQTFESSAPFFGLLNDSETQTMEASDALYQIFNDCDKQTSPLRNLSYNSGTEIHKTTSDSVTQTLDPVTLDSTVQTSTDMSGLETSENLLSFPSEDISCQVNPADLFFNDPVTTLDITTQTLDDLGSNLSTSKVKSSQTSPLIRTEQKAVDPSGSPATGLTSPRSRSQNITTQTPDLIDTLQTLLNSVPGSSNILDRLQSDDKFGLSNQNFESFDLSTSFFDSFDSLTNSADLLDSPREVSKFFGSKKQVTADPNITDAETQTLGRKNNLTKSAFSNAQIQDPSEMMTQTNDVNIKPQTGMFDAKVQSLETFDSMTQTVNDIGTLSPLPDGFLDVSENFTSIDLPDEPVLFDSVTLAEGCVHKPTQTTNSIDNLTQTANNFDTMTQTANSFDTMTQTANNFDTMTQTANNFDTMTQTADSLDMMTQTLNTFDTMTQTANCFDTMTQTANSFDTMTQTANSFDTMTQTLNTFDTMTQTANCFDTMTQTANSFDTMTQTANCFDTMTQTANSFDTMTQTVNLFDMMTQTANSFNTMTQTANSFDTMTQTANSFNTMTQTTNSFDTMTQTTNSFDTMTQTVNNFDIMTQTANNFDIMTQTANNFDIMTQTTNFFDTMTQTGNTNSFDTMTQTANNFDTMTQTANNFDTMTQTPNSFDTMTQTELDRRCTVMTQTQTHQRGDNDLWEMMTQTEKDLVSDLSDMMTQTVNENLWEMTTQTDKIQGSDMMTQTADNVLMKVMSETPRELVSDTTTQTAGDSLQWEMGLASQAVFDLTNDDMLTAKQENDLWEMTTQTDKIMESDMMTQTLDSDFWKMATQTDEMTESPRGNGNGMRHDVDYGNDVFEMNTQTDEVMESDGMTQTQTQSLDTHLWEMTTQTDAIAESDMTTQTLDNPSLSWEEMTTQTEEGLMSNVMTQTLDIDLWEMTSQDGLDLI